MDAINNFIQTCVQVGAGLSVPTALVVDAYVKFNGSTTGKMKLYAQIQAMDNVTKHKTQFVGIALNPKQHTPTTQTQDPQMTPYQIAKLNMKQLEIDTQARIAEADRKENLRLAEEKIREKARIEATKIQATTDIESMKIQATTDIEAMKIQSVERMKAIDVEEKEKDRRLIREENNKNRKMFVATKFNKYIDFQVYGSPAVQYITQESLTDVLNFKMFDATNAIDQERTIAIQDLVKQKASDIHVVEQQTTKVACAVKVDEVRAMIELLARQSNESVVKAGLISLIDQVDAIPVVAKQDEYRFVVPEYTRKKSLQKPDVARSAKSKIEYVRPQNNISMDGDAIAIECYCCSNKIDLKSAGCHRAHDIPKADGGDWSKDNIYLTCSTCNQDMGDQLSVIEYKTQLYVKLTQDQDAQTTV